MSNGIGKLAVYQQQMCAGETGGDVLLNTLESEFTRVLLLLKTKLISILPPYMIKSMG